MDIVKLDSLVSGYEGKMSGNSVHYFFQMSDISIKVNPTAFLSTTVLVDSKENNLEDVCDIYQADEYKVSIVPKSPKYIIAIIKALKLSHPEYRLEDASYMDESKGEEVRYLECHMADVNDDRYDIYKDAINTKYDAVMSKLKLMSQEVKVSVGRELAGAPIEVIKLYNDKIANIESSSYKSCETTRDTKLKEIEDGHKEYLEKNAEKIAEQKQKEQSREASLRASK